MGSPPWRPLRRMRTHEQVIAQIEERILNGRLRVGERLPGEREFAEALGVSRTSVREALRALEAMGIIDAHVGSGPDAGSTVAGRSTAAISNLLRLHMALAQLSLEDLIEVRVQLETGSARNAALRHRPEDVAHLRSLVDGMREANLHYQEFNELDTEFHVSLARASRNALAADLMQALRDSVRSKMTSVFEGLPDWRAVADRLVVEHENILKAVEKSDGDLAASLVERHITGFYRHLILPRNGWE